MYSTYKEILQKYGKPIMRFSPSGNFTKKEIMSEDIPDEIMIVKIKHISEIMVYRKVGKNKWCANYGERWVIRELLKMLDKLS